jgi:AAA domain/TrwC relaxase
MIGRAAGAQAAVELGYGIEADPGPSGRLGHWRIAGVPDEVIEVHSKRAAAIDAECEKRGDNSFRARGVAARVTRKAKEAEAVETQLVERWQAELAEIGWPVERLAASIDDAATGSDPIRRIGLKEARKLVSEILGQDGDLDRRKVFFRRDVIVAIAPHLYGQDPRLVEALADRALADPESIPLIRVPGARERPYTLASVVAREVAIAESLARQIGRSDAPTVDTAGVERAISAVEEGLYGGSLGGEQREAVEAICTSGRGGELVVGVAGAGKTTMLRAVSAAFEEAGFRVVGTATSGQAARNLGKEADISESRTLAGLIWRLDHGQLSLDDRTVVVLDEVGMTDDIALARLAAHTEASRAKLVLVGDHRQLAAVGPGGALQAFVRRYPDAVHHLVDNRRQRDPEERRMLAELRDGDVSRAVSWYEEHGRVHPVSDRVGAVQAAVDAWAADITAGREASMYSWRRANVAALNQAARAWMSDTGRLHGPQVVCPGGLAFRAGDQVVTLAPGPGGTPATSERGVVEAVDPTAGTLVIRTREGRKLTLTGDQASAHRLGYCYATTVHRSQGPTIERAHLLADGGGRELAYVAMSRARESTHIWTVADNAAQAAEDLRRDWETRRSPTWTIDLAPPPLDKPQKALDPGELDQRARQCALISARDQFTHRAATGIRAPNIDEAVQAGQEDLQRAVDARADLENGAGVYHDTEAGRAGRDLQQARSAREQAEHEAQHASGWLQRRASNKELALSVEREADAQRRYQHHVVPEAARLDKNIGACRVVLEQIEDCREQYRQAERAVAGLASQSSHNASRLDRHLTVHRNQIDGIPQPAQVAPAQRLRFLPQTVEPTTPELGTGI